MIAKSVLITGCSEGGIGDALAKVFHSKGLRVFATARNLAKVQHLAAMGIEILPLDVVNSASIAAAVESITKLTGRTLDFLVNNSGMGYQAPVLDSDIEVARKMFDLNVFALIAVTQAFTPLLIASKGTIINIGSVAGTAPIPYQGFYNASKAAVNILTDQLRIELSPWSIRTILVVTGGIKTNFFSNLGGDGPKLAPSSLYHPARADIEPIMAGSLVEKDGMDVDVYANAVVKNALSWWPSKHQWIGSSSFVIWFFSVFMWSTVWDLALPFFTKMPETVRKIRAAEKAK